MHLVGPVPTNDRSKLTCCSNASSCDTSLLPPLDVTPRRPHAKASFAVPTFDVGRCGARAHEVCSCRCCHCAVVTVLPDPPAEALCNALVLQISLAPFPARPPPPPQPRSGRPWQEPALRVTALTELCRRPRELAIPDLRRGQRLSMLRKSCPLTTPCAQLTVKF